MAEIVVKMNTNDKTFGVTIDGKEVPDVDSVSLYKRYPYSEAKADEEDTCYCCINIREDEDDGMVRHTSIHASEAQFESEDELYEPEGFEGCVATVRTEKSEARARPADLNVEPELVNDMTEFLATMRK
jgi:hypothetical protein